MGAPTATQIQNQTDRIAALINLDLAGFQSELSGATNTSLWDFVDAVGDADYEATMMSYALAIDRHSLPENYKTALADILGRAAYANFATSLNTFLKSAAGGSHADLRAYLTTNSATVHPLFAELCRRAINAETLFTLSDDVTTVFAPNYQSRAPARVYTGADGSLAEDTTDATDVGTADVALFASDNDYLYIGSPYKFSQVVVGLSTLANVTIDPAFAYYNGSAWASLTVTDNSTGFTVNDTLKWTVPGDWQRTYNDSGGTAFPNEDTPLYYIRIQRQANTLGTPPVGSIIRIIPEPVLDANGAHLGVDQPPIGLIRITAATTIVVEALNTVAYARWAEPGVRFRALTPFSGSPVITLAYVQQTGSDGSKAQSAWTTPAALDTVAVTLDTGHTGIRSVRTTGNSVSSGTQGVIEVYCAESRTPAL